MNTQPGHHDQGSASSEASTREEWVELAADPDPERNLGYRLTDWEEYPAIDGTNQVMFVPGEESLCERDAFLVVDEDAVCDVERRC